MRFGTKFKDVVDTSGDIYLRTFKKGDTEVHFLEEIEDWIQFREHYSLEGQSFPCTGDRKSCPGCTHPNEKVNRAANRYVANAVLVRNGAVFAFKMGKTLVDRLATRSERNGGTIMNRTYTIMRSGEGLDTEYDVEQGDKDPSFDPKKYKADMVNVEEVLQANFKAAFGDFEDKPKRHIDADEDERNAKRSVRQHSEKGSFKDDEDDVPPSKPAVTRDTDEQEEVFDEDEVRAMKRPQLVALYEKAGLAVDEDMSTRELADFLISEVGK